MLLLLTLLPFAAAAVVAPLWSRAHRFAAGISVLVPLGTAVALLSLAPAVWRGEPLLEPHAWAPSVGVSLSFHLDGLSLLFSLLISGIGALVLLYSQGYLHGSPNLGRFCATLLFFMGSMLGVVLANNLVALFVFWELTSFSSYLLIGFESSRLKARNAALQALLVTGIGGLALLAGAVLLALAAGSYEITEVLAAGGLRQHALYLPILLLILGAAFTKSAQFPFHFWLPSAMEAPAPVSAYLHSATMVKAGVYLLARLNPALGGGAEWPLLLGLFGGATMLIGVVVAFFKNDLKQILAYSTIGVLGTLVLMIGVGTPDAFKAMAAYLLAHALYKGSLFLMSGAVDHETGTRDIGELSGLRRAMPLTAAVALIAAVSMAGLPPTLGFIGKELLYESANHAPAYAWLVTAALAVNGAILFAVAAMAGYKPFAGPLRSPKPPHEAPWTLWTAPGVAAVLGLVLGLAPRAAESAIRSAASAVAGAPVSVELSLFHGFNLPLLLTAAGVIVGGLLYIYRSRIAGLAPRSAPVTAGGVYDRLLAALVGFAALQTRWLQSGYLRAYLKIIILTAVLLGGYALLTRNAAAAALSVSDARFHELIVGGLILAGTIATVRARSRMISVAAVGAVGVGVSLIFVLFGAPDLAMTQLTIEALTVVLLVFVFHHLPDFSLKSRRPVRVLDVALCATAGVFMGALVLAAGAERPWPSISSYFTDNSRDLAGGRNVVNVILTDFRGLDTFGEITVLAIAGIGVYALLRLNMDEIRRREGARTAPSEAAIPAATTAPDRETP
ncbi:MAG: DUF4040 domain-containing protein [Bryobacteraceae bacterium]|nr:DUF4040 domain-containing protein [Bryobacteraceae bacterium]